ncbi:MAG: enolase C-terminal domain-like protein [Rhodospirillales bacterium]
MRETAVTIESLRVRPVLAPLRRPLVVASGQVETAPLIAIDLRCAGGPVGHAYIFTYTPQALAPAAKLLEEMGGLLVGRTLAPYDLERFLQAKFRLLGVTGLVTMALAGLDMAAWDAAAKQVGLPLARLLGGSAQALPAYNSNGLGIVGAEAAAREAGELLGEGFSAIKLRLGYPSLAEDLAVLEAVRRAVGDETAIMVDYNQSLSYAEALARVLALDDHDLAWIEEPLPSDDLAGHARLRAKARTPIQLGENFWSPRELARALEAGAGDLYMPDLMKIGGPTAWLRCAALAEPAGIPLSCHLFPDLSAHLLAVTPTRHWVEFVDWAEPIRAERVRRGQGTVIVEEKPGFGLEWDEGAIARYAA